MNKYTVLLLRPDYIADEFGTDTYLAHVEAASVAEAERMAQLEAVCSDLGGDWTNGPDRQVEDYAVLCVIEGHHMDIKTA